VIAFLKHEVDAAGKTGPPVLHFPRWAQYDPPPEPFLTNCVLRYLALPP